MARLTFLVLCLMLCGLQQCQGIKLTLERGMTSIPGRPTTCGVLTCVERKSDVGGITPSPKYVDTNTSSIIKMTLYKTGLGKQEFKIVASVDSQEPRISRVIDAVEVNGQLDPFTATMRLGLFKSDDCRGEFTCEVVAVDATGKELVKTSQLVQQPATPSSDTTSGEGWTPAVTMHLVDLVQKLTTSVELMKSTIGDYGDRVIDVEDKLATLEKDVASSIVTHEKELGDKVLDAKHDVRNKLDSFENRIIDKFTSLEKEVYKLITSNEGVDEKIEKKLCRVEDNAGSCEKKVLDKLDGITDNIQSSLTSLMDFFEGLQEKKMKDDLSSPGSNISKTNSDFTLFVTAIKSKMEQSFKTLKQEIQSHDSSLAKNLEETLDQIVFNSTKRIVSGLNRLNSLEASIEGYFQGLSVGINKSAEDTQSVVRDTVGGSDVAWVSKIASMVAESIAPKTCKRGMISLLTQPSYPYPLVIPGPGDPLNVPYLCDTLTDGGGWILIQRRTTGNVDFYRTWADYKRGFGSLDDDFWLGNDNIHAITSSGDYELNVELRYNGRSAYAHYTKFAITDEVHKYALTLGTYDGTAGDSFTRQAGAPFSTRDRDNDSYSGNCAVRYTGAWWYTNCHDSNLNGKWNTGNYKGPGWQTFSNANAVAFSEMKIRKVNP